MSFSVQVPNEHPNKTEDKQADVNRVGLMSSFLPEERSTKLQFDQIELTSKRS